MTDDSPSINLDISLKHLNGLLFSIFGTISTDKSVIENLSSDINSADIQTKLREFLEEDNLKILYVQFYHSIPHEDKLQQADDPESYDTRDLKESKFSLFSTIDQINVNNILLCILMKKSQLRITRDILNNLYIQIFHGRLSDERFFVLLNCNKPLVENFFLHAAQKQDHMGEIMRTYSDYEITLFQLQTIQNFECIKCTIHPMIEEYLKHHPDWDETYSEFQATILDENILKEVYNNMLSWLTDIQRLLQLDVDLYSSDSCLVEIACWKNKDLAVKKIIDDFKTPQVLFTLKLLEDSSYRTLNEKITTILISDKFTSINRIYTFLNTLKLHDIVNATNIDELCTDTKSILHILERHHVNNYPLDRIFGLCSLISRDLNKSILRTFPSLNQLTLEDFSYNGSVFKILSLHTDFLTFITSLKTTYRQQAGQIKDKLRRYTDVYSETIKLTVDKLKDLQKLFESFQFCDEFFEILQAWVSANTYKEIPISITDIIQTMPNLKLEWFNFLKSIDLLDFTKNGMFLWNQRISDYHTKLESRDSSFVDCLRILLSNTSSDDEKIDIFVHFTYIFKKFPMIKSIHTIQNQLVDKIYQYMINEKENILKSSSVSIKNFKKLFPFGNHSMQLMNFKKMTEKYKQYIFYTYCILGPNYKMMDVSKRIIIESNDWLRKNLALNTLNTLAEKNQSLKKSNVLLFKPLEDIETSLVAVNFPIELIRLSLDEICAKALGYTLTSFYWLESNMDKYKCFQIIDQALKNLNRIKKDFSKKREILLISLYIEKANLKIIEGISCQWDSTHLQRYTYEFSECVVILHEKSDIINGISADIAGLMEQLRSAEFKYDTFKEILSAIKQELSSLEKYQLINVEYYMNLINQEVEDLLFSRLETSLIDLVDFVQSQPFDREHLEVESLYSKSILFRTRCINIINFDIKFQNEEIFITPSLLKLRNYLYDQLNLVINVVISQEHILYNLSVGQIFSAQRHYKHLLKRLLENNYLYKVFMGVEKIITDVNKFYRLWTSLKSLWEADLNQITNKFTLVEQWLDFYNSLNSLKFISTNKCYRIFPFVVIRYKLIKAHLNRVYNQLVDHIFKSISDTFNNQNELICNEIKEEKLKMKSFEIKSNASLNEIIGKIGEYDAWNQKINHFKSSVDTINSVRLLLDSNKISYKLPTLNIAVEYDEICHDYEVCKVTLDSSLHTIRVKLDEESKYFIDSIKSTLHEWNSSKIEYSKLDIKEVIEMASQFEVKLKEGLDYLRNFTNAKRFLKIADSLEDSYNLPSKLEAALDELSDIKQAWEFVGSISDKITHIGQETFTHTSSHKLATFFNNIEQEMDKHTSFKAFDCFLMLQTKVLNIQKSNEMINSFRSEFFKDRHWRLLFSSFNVSFHPSNVTISQLWSLDLSEHANIYNDIFTIAQGEFGLENYLKSIEDYWTCSKFILIPFKNKFEIINNWPEILNKLGDHINGIESMKASPYFKEFAISVDQWLEKLTFLLNLSETWIEVQRKWIYLSGIFIESSDIGKLLANESSKFTFCTNEFSSLLHKISKDPAILNVFLISGITNNLEQLLEYFNQIQKSLSKYLENERESFPRFYFVGDEDLLEILGNSGDLGRIQNHLKKMFTGISKLIFTEDNLTIIGVNSKEKEMLTLESPIILSEHKNIISWLKALENSVTLTLAVLLKSALTELRKRLSENFSESSYFEWIEKYPQQLIIVAEKIHWCSLVEEIFQTEIDKSKKAKLEELHVILETRLHYLTLLVTNTTSGVVNLKMINLITNLVYMRNKIRVFIQRKVVSINNFDWLCNLRYYFSDKNYDSKPPTCCIIKISDCEFTYGFEYLGVIDYIIQTPLIDNCFLVLTQALNMKLGGSPFGPAGTGKTESVKALGAHLGRMVIVFNCDATFDFQAMGRIFIGLCRVGAWGCFDEFNRLEERIISAVSQQIHSIQTGLRSLVSETSQTVELLGRNVALNVNVAIFITMNPDYAGRSRLPNNLKQLFRSFAMTQPDRELISQVILYSQGFSNAEILASKIVPLLKLCKEQFSQQYHYDFGLRTLKYILVSAGTMIRQSKLAGSDTIKGEQELIVQSVIQSILPKLTSEDEVLFYSIIGDVFPGVLINKAEYMNLLSYIKTVCDEMSLEYVSNDGSNSEWLEKILYLSEIIGVNHGIILVGESSTGKTSCWKVLLEALHRYEEVNCHYYSIDPKAVTKETLYGSLDPITRVWNDGVFTAIIRNIIENCSDVKERHWIVFDGDIDPEWVENLNSTLDDNKLFTLPNGERLFLPPNVRIIFEVSTLKYTTPATISRCGMIYFSESTIRPSMILKYYLNLLAKFNHDTDSAENPFNDTFLVKPKIEPSEQTLKIQTKVVDMINRIIGDADLLKIVEFCRHISHCMEFSVTRSLQSFCLLVSNKLREIFRNKNIDRENENLDSFISNLIIYGLIWGFVSDASKDDRLKFCMFLEQNINGLKTANSIINCQPTVDGGLKPWKDMVTFSNIAKNIIMSNDFMVSTEETTLYSNIIYYVMNENRSLILCGPPGSGKTMLIHNMVKNLHSWDILPINFSSATTSEDLLRYMLQKCEYRKGPNNLYLCPKNKNLIVFCDEINLANIDQYGTQSAICLLRQFLEMKGFYHKDRVFVKLERIKFIASCCPPSFVGLNKLPPKFLRHNFILFIDYPTNESLQLIYNNLNSFLDLENNKLCKQSTDMMVEFYEYMKESFTTDLCAHYVYTPRDLTYWVQGTVQLTNSLTQISKEEIVDAIVYEGSRVFIDRIIGKEHKIKTMEKLKAITATHFPFYSAFSSKNNNKIYTNWIHGNYSPTDYSTLLSYCLSKIENNQSLAYCSLFDQLLEVTQYINRIVDRHQGHIILIGKDGSGRKSAIKLVSSILDLYVYKVRWHKYWSISDFDEDLRDIIKRILTKNETVLAIVDESSWLPPSFYERINCIISGGNVSDLYHDEKYAALISTLKDVTTKLGLDISRIEDLHQWLMNKINTNFHFVFSFSDNLASWSEKVSKYSYLFKKCSVKWCGDWTNVSFAQVAAHSLSKMDFSFSEYDFNPETYICPEVLSSPCLINSVIDCLISIHLSFRLKLKFTYDQTPTTQKFLLFLKQFKNILTNKLKDLEEEHSHISTGLIKLEQTFSEVATMKAELSTKKKDLEIKNNKASQKLSLMATEQQKAQITREEAMTLFDEVKVQSEKISVKSKDIKQELAMVEPALEEAKDALSIIDRNMLNEIRVMFKPPQLIQLAIESVYVLITGQDVPDWKAVKSFINKEDFIQTVRNFKTENVTPERRLKMEKYLSNEKYNPESIARGSTACVPLVKWVKAHIGYSDILLKIEPLRNELSDLEKENEAKEKQAIDLQNSINELEAKIEQYKNEYSVLIREIEDVKQVLIQIERKVEISSTLLTSLEIEQSRWAESHKTFQLKKNCLIGNCLLSSAFIVYFGDFNKKTRDILWNTWIDILNYDGILFENNFLRVEYLSLPDDRLAWTKHGLPDEDLCFENATILKYSKNYPFIVDPSGQASTYLISTFKDRKAIVTSFLSANFKKEMERALRFGNVLIINNGEFFDSILINLIEQDFKYLDNRKVINMAGQDIDFSPSFNMFVITTDPNHNLPSNVSSKMCVVNFTITFSGLESQCLHQIFKKERPDLEEKRLELTKMQGEYRLTLYNLQKDLLKILNEAQGGLLDDDRIVKTLQQLNKQSLEINTKVMEAENHLIVVNESLQFYLPFATICSSMYFMLQEMCSINNLYRYSLGFFLEIFNSVFKEVQPSPINDSNHLEKLVKVMMKNLIQRLIFGLLQKDKQLFLILLSRICISHTPNSSLLVESLDFIFTNKSIVVAKDNWVNYDKFSRETNQSLNRLRKLRQFFNSSDKIRDMSEKLISWSQGPKTPESCPVIWDTGENTDNKIYNSLNQLLIIYCFSPTDILSFFDQFLNCVLGQDIIKIYYSQLNLRSIVFDEVAACTPIVLLSVPGFDPTTWINDLISDIRDKNMIVVAMGSPESCVTAEKSVISASKAGQWLVLKNVHLCSHWIKDLEKIVFDLKPHNDFRLFLTAEITSQLPSSLLRLSRCLIFEPPPGVKPCLSRTFDILTKPRTSKNPKERSKIYFLLAWVHALIIERLSYSNLGWSKLYEFSESDLRVALDMVDSWIDRVAQDRINLPPDKMPWDAMKFLLCSAIYGAYMESIYDSKILKSIIQEIFDQKSFESDCQLVSQEDEHGLEILVPTMLNYDDYVEWIKNLPNQQNTSWLKLPKNAERILLKCQLDNTILKFLKMSEQTSGISQDLSIGLAEERKIKISICLDFAEYWLNTLPASFEVYKFTYNDSIFEPLYRFFEREFKFGEQLLNTIRDNLNQIILYSQGTIKINNDLDAIISNIKFAKIPKTWLSYIVPSNLSLNSWLKDFSSRLNRLNEIAKLMSTNSINNLQNYPFIVGKFFFPEAFSTAIRQLASRRLKIPLEKLNIKISLIPNQNIDNEQNVNASTKFTLGGLKVLGCKLDDLKLKLSDDLYNELPYIHIEWVDNDTFEKEQTDNISIPIYLDHSRRNVLFEMEFNIMSKDKNLFYQHGVAVFANQYDD